MLSAKFPFDSNDIFYYIEANGQPFVARTKEDFDKIEERMEKWALDGKVEVVVMNKYYSVEKRFASGSYLFIDRTKTEPDRYAKELIVFES
jgi:hypothetical protein